MMTTVPDRSSRAPRLPAPILVVALALAWVAAAIAPEGRPGEGEYVHADHNSASLPAGTLTQRGLDLQGPDRSRDGAAGLRRPGHLAGWTAERSPSGAETAPTLEPAGSARRALQRAGRLSAPATAPPLLS
jgi:hypothetical protein